MGYRGIASGYPQIESTTYTQAEDHSLYIDKEMTALFQKINSTY